MDLPWSNCILYSGDYSYNSIYQFQVNNNIYYLTQCDIPNIYILKILSKYRIFGNLPNEVFHNVQSIKNKLYQRFNTKEIYNTNQLPEIIKRYNEVNPNIIYELKFEKLINNPEEESKNLMKFCELPWDKKCLEFYKRKDMISKTTSRIQIRKPIYKHSSDKYLPYKKLLDKYGNKYSWFN